MTQGNELLREWMRQAKLDALDVARLLKKAADEEPYITQPRRESKPPTTIVKAWTKGAKPWKRYRRLLELASDGFVPETAWEEAAP